MKVSVEQQEIYGLVELLNFVADLCACQQEDLNVALCRFTAGYYPAKWLRDDVTEVADRLARAIGFKDSSMGLAE